MRTIVTTTRGRLEGRDEGGLVVFRGVPYAAAPDGARRFLPPEPAAPWVGVRPAHAFGLAAAQNAAEMGPLFQLGLGATGEDCLFLNIWTPALDGA